jgi:predicted 3-demethylubiquinone-9 3-methyltransferase (glyoxalase superfamily)
MKPITPCLWFDDQAEEAVEFYVSVFANSKILGKSYYPKDIQSPGGQTPGALATISFEINGQPFVALNGGPHFKMSEAVSWVIKCKDQAEIDDYTAKLSAAPESEICGWVKDRFGVSWQIWPEILDDLLHASPGVQGKVMAAVWGMKKIDIAKIEEAAKG